MERRVFVTGLAVVLAMPRGAIAQPVRRVFRVGILSSGNPTRIGDDSASDRYVAALLKQLRQLGYVHGTNLTVDARWAAGNIDRLPQLATDLVALNVDVILAAGNPAISGARRATMTIPVVMLSSSPVESGFVQTLARPGGNATGLTLDVGTGLWGKRLELLKEAAPQITRVGVLSRSGGREGAWVTEVEGTARRLRVVLIHAGTRRLEDFRSAFSELVAGHADALLASDTPVNFQFRDVINKFVTTRRWPAMHAYREAAAEGGLLSYGVDVADTYRKAATYIDKILKGANPADLPVEQPTKFEFVINMKTAKALGLKIPPSVLARADEVIE